MSDYPRQDLDTAAIGAGLKIRSMIAPNGTALLIVLTERGCPVFALDQDSIFDPNGMRMSLENIRDATAEEAAMFRLYGPPGAALRSEDCSVSFEREG